LPSLSIRDADGKVLVRCHAGCEQWEVIAALRSRGLWNADGRPEGLLKRAGTRTAPDRDNRARTERALAMWRQSQPARGTLAETYLRSRGPAMQASGIPACRLPIPSRSTLCAV
jgi:hypothetical protein